MGGYDREGRKGRQGAPLLPSMEGGGMLTWLLPAGAGQGGVEEGIQASSFAMLPGDGSSGRKVGGPRDGLDGGRSRSGGKDGEEFKLSHKEVTSLLKSALQAAGNAKEVGNMKNKSGGATRVASDIP